MAQILKTYTVTCPDCDEEFQVSRDPAELAKGDGELIDCPYCYTEFEWDYDEETDTLELAPYDDEQDEDDGLSLTEDDFEDEDE